MKLEMVNPFDSEELCSATLVRVLGHMVQVHVDAPLRAPSTPASRLASRCPFTDLDPPEPRLVADGAPIESALESFGETAMDDEKREMPVGLSLLLPSNSSELFPVGWARHFRYRFAPPLQLAPALPSPPEEEPPVTAADAIPETTGESIAPPTEETVAEKAGGADAESEPSSISPAKQLLDKTLDMSALNTSGTVFLAQ